MFVSSAKKFLFNSMLLLMKGFFASKNRAHCKQDACAPVFSFPFLTAKYEMKSHRQFSPTVSRRRTSILSAMFISRNFSLRSLLPSLLKLLHFWFPVALGWSVAQVVQRATGEPLYTDGLMLFLSGIWAAYSLDRIADSAPNQPLFLRFALWFGLVVSIILCAFSASFVSVKTLSAVAVFSFLAILYRRLKKYPLLKTLIVAIVWVWASVALTIANNEWFSWSWWTMNATLPLILLIAAGCILCDFKDLEADKRHDVKSVPVMFGVRKTVLIVTILAGAAAAVAFSQHRPGLLISSLVLILFAQYPSILAVEDVGPLLVDFTLSLPGILIAAKVI